MARFGRAQPIPRRIYRRPWLAAVLVAMSGRKPMRHNGSVVGIIVRLTEARVAGTAEFEVTIDDVKTGLTATIDAANPQQVSVTQAQGLDAFFAGAVLGVVVTTDSFDPTTTVPLLWVEVVEDLTT